MMKNLLTLLLFTALVTSSCSTEDQIDIEGTWMVLSLEIVGSTTQDNGEKKTVEYATSPCVGPQERDCFYKELTFENGIYSYSNTSFENGNTDNSSRTGTYTTFEDYITICDASSCDRFIILCEDGVTIFASDKSETFNGGHGHYYLQKI